MPKQYSFLPFNCGCALPRTVSCCRVPVLLRFVFFSFFFPLERHSCEGRDGFLRQRSREDLDSLTTRAAQKHYLKWQSRDLAQNPDALFQLNRRYAPCTASLLIQTKESEREKSNLLQSKKKKTSPIMSQRNE